VTTRRFLLVVVAGLSMATLCLALADVLDSPALAVVGAVSVLGVFVAREGWVWSGAGRQWLMVMGGLAAVILVAFVAQQLLG